MPTSTSTTTSARTRDSAIAHQRRCIVGEQISVALPAVDHTQDRCYHVPGCILHKQCSPRPVDVHLILAKLRSKEWGQPHLHREESSISLRPTVLRSHRRGGRTSQHPEAPEHKRRALVKREVANYSMWKLTASQLSPRASRSTTRTPASRANSPPGRSELPPSKLGGI
jgi:hypothetical protein